MAAAGWMCACGTASATPAHDLAAGPIFWLRWAAALALCLALAAAGAAALKARQVGASPLAGWRMLRGAVRFRPLTDRRLRLVENLRVGPQLEVVLLECDDEELLLASTGHSAVLLRQRPKSRP